MGAYEEFVKTIPGFERVSEPLSGTDNRLDFLGPKIINLEDRMTQVDKMLAQLQLPEGVSIMPLKIEQLVFCYKLEKAGVDGSQVKMEEGSPFKGYITDVDIHGAIDACTGLVEFRLSLRNQQVLPPEEYGRCLALNETTQHFPMSRQVNEGDTVTLELFNGDQDNTHGITVNVTIKGEGESQ